MANDSTGRPAAGERSSALVEVEHIDEDGLRWRVLVPKSDREHTERGIVIGPPDLTSLGLPDDIHKVLHNALYNRGIIRARDVRRRMPDVFAALQSAYRVDATMIANAYGQ